MTLRKHTLTLPLMAGVFALGILVSGCAPEGTPPSGGGLHPGEIGTEPQSSKQQSSKQQSSGADEKGVSRPIDEVPTEDFGGRQPVEVEKVHTLPESFPVEDVRIPDGVIIDHAGERDRGSWFAVLHFSSFQEAQTSLDTILADFVLDTDDSDSESLYREYSNASFTVEALAFSEGAITVLSLDVAPKE